MELKQTVPFKFMKPWILLCYFEMLYIVKYQLFFMDCMKTLESPGDLNCVYTNGFIFVTFMKCLVVHEVDRG